MTNPSPKEGDLWEQLLKAGRLVCHVYQPPHIDTVIAGQVRPYLDIERVLIATKKPILNRGRN